MTTTTTMAFSKIKSLIGHEHVINCVKEIGTKGLIATASADHSIRIWSSSTGKCLHTIKSHKHEVIDLAAFNETTILAVSMDKKASILDVQNGKVLKSIRFLNTLHSCSVLDCATAIVGDCKGDLYPINWDGEVMKKGKRIKAHDSIISSITVHNDMFCTASFDNTAVIWDSPTMTPQHRFRGHREEIFSVAFNDQYVVTASNDKTICVHDAATFKHIKTIRTHSKPIWDVIIIEGTDIIVSGGDDLHIALHTLPNGECIARHDADMDISSIIRLSNGHFAVGGCAPCEVKIFDIPQLPASVQLNPIVDLCSQESNESEGDHNSGVDQQFNPSYVVKKEPMTDENEDMNSEIQKQQVNQVSETAHTPNCASKREQFSPKIDTREYDAVQHFRWLISKTGRTNNALRIDEAADALNEVLKMEGSKYQTTTDQFEEMFIELTDDIHVSEENLLKIYREVTDHEKLLERQYITIFNQHIKGRSKTRIQFAARMLFHACKDIQERGMLGNRPLIEEKTTLELMAKFDKDGDGRVNRQEFVDAALTIVHGIEREW